MNTQAHETPKGHRLPRPEVSTRQLAGAFLTTVALIGSGLVYKSQAGSADHVRPVSDQDAKVTVVDYSSPAALRKGPQTPVTIEKNEGPDTLAERVIPASLLDSTDKLRDNVLTDLAQQEPAGFQPGDKVTLPSSFVNPAEAAREARPQTGL